MRHAHYKLLPHRERARPMVAANFSAVYLQARRRARQVVPFNTPADIAGLKLWLDAGFGTLAAWAVAPASGGFWIDYSPSSGYVASSATHKIRIYPFKTVSGSRVYSASYLELETTDDGSTLFYAINWSWDAVVGAEGYRLLKSDAGSSYSFDYYTDVFTNAWVDASAGALAAGSTVLPQLLSAAGPGESVTRWNDQSGLGNDATQNNATARATLQTNVVNGRPVLRFDSDDGYTTPLGLNTPCTVFAVYALTGLGDLARRAVQGSNNWLLGPYGPPHEFFNGVSFTGGPALTRAVFVAQAAWQNASVSRNWINGMFVGAALGAGGGPGTVGLGTGGSNFEPLFKAHDAQALQWPRELARDDDALRSVALVALSPRDEFFPSNAIPTALRDATIETARELIKANRADDPQGEGLASMSITGSMSLTFDKRDRAPIIPHVALPTLTRRALAAVFRLGAPVVRAGAYVRPPTFNSTTGQMISAEGSAACSFIGAHVQTAGYLGLAPVVPGTERLLVRASELTSIISPARGDYLVESGTGQRRNIEGARLDVSGEFYTFQALASLDEDWGDLVAHGSAEDFGDLSSATTFDDWMTLH